MILVVAINENIIFEILTDEYFTSLVQSLNTASSLVICIGNYLLVRK